jgi:hypothetical protein
MGKRYILLGFLLVLGLGTWLQAATALKICDLLPVR